MRDLIKWKELKWIWTSLEQEMESKHCVHTLYGALIEGTEYMINKPGPFFMNRALWIESTSK